MQRCDVTGKLLPAKNLAAGDEVELLKGPFANFVATVETIDMTQGIWVLIDCMGHAYADAPDHLKLYS